MNPIVTLVQSYVPGVEWLVAAVIGHMLLGTAAHIKAKDFNFSMWPNYMMNFAFFLFFLGLTNGLLGAATVAINNTFLATLLKGLQALVYVQVFGYYLDNILKSASALGMPVSPELMAAISTLTAKIRSMVGL